MSTIDHSLKYRNKEGKASEHRRRNRHDTAIELRKNKREDNLAKRRNIIIDPNDSLEGDSDIKENVDTNNIQNQQEGGNIKSSRAPTPILPISKIVNGIITNSKILQGNTPPNYTQLYEAVQHCRKMLSREKKPPIDQIIETGLVPYLSELLLLDQVLRQKLEMNSSYKKPDSDEIVYSTIFEAAWALTNICSGTSQQTHAVVAVGALPKFIRLLTITSHMNIVEQAAWALGNIAGDGPELRDKVLKSQVLPPLLNLLSLPESTVPFLQNTTWTLSNLCRNKDPPTHLNYVRELLPGLVSLLGHHDRQIKTDAGWAMSYLTDGTNDRIDTVLQYGALQPLIKLLQQSNELSVLTPVLRTIGNIVTGTDVQTQKVIDTGALNCFHNLLTHQKSSIQKEAAWTLSNITAGNAEQIQAVVDAGLVNPIMSCLANGEFRTQKESVWVVTNYTSGGTSEQVRLLCQSGVIKYLCNLLVCNDDRIVSVILDGIQNILIHAEKLDCLESAVDLIEECEGLDKIEQLQNSPNEQIYQGAYKLIDTYFGEEEEGEIANVQCTNDKGNEFKFEEACSGPEQAAGFNF